VIQQDLQALKKVAVGVTGALMLFAAGVARVAAEGDSRADVLERIQPVGYAQRSGAPESAAAAPATAKPAPVAIAEPAPAPAAEMGATAVDGQAVYGKACMVCHGAGVAGAPKLGDAAAWAPRIAQGKDTLLTHALNGFQGRSGVMPAKGGSTNLSDDEVSAAIDYMVSQSQ